MILIVDFSSSCFWLGTGTAHEPPSILVMKEQRWFVASEMVTQLLNNGGEVESFRLFSPIFSHQSLKILWFFYFFVGNGSAGEQTSADQYLHSPSKGGVSRLGWSRRTSPSAGKKEGKKRFIIFSLSLFLFCLFFFLSYMFLRSGLAAD